MTTVAPNTYAQTGTIGSNVYKPSSPGAVVTQTVITTQPTGTVHRAENKGLAIFSTIMSVLAGCGMWIGAVLVIIAMGLLLGDFFANYRAVGGLLIAAFSLWFLSSFCLWAPSFSGFGKTTRSGYHIANFFAKLLEICAFALFLAGAACLLSDFLYPRYAGPILWIIAGSLWLGALLIRDMGVRFDAMNTYKNYPAATTDTTDKWYRLHVSSIWSNSLANDLYLIAATLFLLGAIMFVCSNTNAGIESYTSREFQVAGAIMWIVGASLILLASIAQCIARR
jgi:hypothetical protein